MTATRRCRYCGHPIELWTSFGRWMHVTLGEENPSTVDGTAWWHCEVTTATPRPSGGEETEGPRWRVGAKEGEGEEEEKEESTLRLVDRRGHQIVEVLGRYGYTWSGFIALEVGDRVLLPSNFFEPEPWEATVTGLGSTWRGSFSSVIRKLPKEE